VTKKYFGNTCPESDDAWVNIIAVDCEISFKAVLVEMFHMQMRLIIQVGISVAFMLTYSSAFCVTSLHA